MFYIPKFWIGQVNGNYVTGFLRAFNVLMYIVTWQEWIRIYLYVQHFQFLFQPQYSPPIQHLMGLVFYSVVC